MYLLNSKFWMAGPLSKQIHVVEFGNSREASKVDPVTAGVPPDEMNKRW
jgi:hypothetical protein